MFIFFAFLDFFPLWLLPFSFHVLVEMTIVAFVIPFLIDNKADDGSRTSLKTVKVGLGARKATTIGFFS